MDRYDYRALRDDCNSATIEEWEEAVEWNFKIENWPYVNAESEKVRECYSKMDKNSLENLSRDNAIGLLLSQTMTAMVFLLTLTIVFS